MIFTDFNQVNQALPKSGRLIALDLGTKRIGIALSDETRFLATPKLILNRLSNVQDFAKIKNFIAENSVVAIVIGHPFQMDGSPQPMTEFAEKFAKNFDEFLEGKFPIFLFEERLSSSEAREFNSSPLSRKKNKFIDDIAASVILQHFIDSLCHVTQHDIGCCSE
jgi:putative Holliday junction resolvase